MRRGGSRNGSGIACGPLGAACLLAFSLSCGVGCAGGAAEMKVMQADLAKIQKDHEALEKRVGTLEDEKKSEHASTETPTTTPTPSKPGDKPLKVVKLEPKSNVENDVEAPPAPNLDDDDEPRPLLKIGPSGAIEQTYPDEGSPGIKKKPKVPKSTANDPQATADYESAMALVKAKKLKPALDAFAGFILRYPDHPYVANATYWRGECYFSLGEYSSAAAQLDGMIARFPTSAKVPDALLKLGMAQKKLGSPSKAKAAFDRLRKEFPLTEAAKKIPPEDAK